MRGPHLFRLLVPAMCAGWLACGWGASVVAIPVALAGTLLGVRVLLKCTLDRQCRRGVVLFGLGLGWLAGSIQGDPAWEPSRSASPRKGEVGSLEILRDMGRVGRHHRAEAVDGRGQKVMVEWHEPLSPGTVCLAGFHQRAPAAPLHPADFNEAQFMRGRGIRAIVRLEWCSAPTVVNRMRHRAHAVRNSVIARIRAVDDGEAGGLLVALTTGDKQMLPASLKRAFSQAGLAHLMAVSGFHTGLVVAGILSLLRVLGCPVRWRALIVVPAVWAYVAIVGFPSSAVRAGSMVTLWAAAGWAHRKAEGLTLLAAAGAVLWSANPDAPRDLGTGLSFMATCGILLLHRSLRDRDFSQWRRKILMAVGVPLVATAFTAPLSWPAFGQVPLVFLPANLAATPIVMGLVLMTALWLACPPLAEGGMAKVTVCLTGLFIRGVEHAAIWPPVQLPLSRMVLMAAGLALACGAAVGLMASHQPWRHWLAGALTAWGLIRMQQHHESCMATWSVGRTRICVDAGVVSVFPASRHKEGQAPLNWKTRTLLERVSSDDPDTVHWCGEALSFSAYRLRYRTRDGAWTEPVNSSRSHSGSHAQRRFPMPPSP